MPDAAILSHLTLDCFAALASLATLAMTMKSRGRKDNGYPQPATRYNLLLPAISFLFLSAINYPPQATSQIVPPRGLEPLFEP